MLKRTLGKWQIGVVDASGPCKFGIFVDDGSDSKEPLEPTLGDYTLVANAPEMYDLLWEILTVLSEDYVHFSDNDRDTMWNDTMIDRVIEAVVPLLREMLVKRSDTRKILRKDEQSREGESS